MSGDYGQFVRSTWGTARAHRVSFMWANGPISYGKVIDHLCRVTTCVNPDHLEAISDRENILRGIGSPAQNARASQCKNGHPLVPGNLYEPKLLIGERQCLICMRDRARIAHYKRGTESPNAAICSECARLLHVRKNGTMHKHLRTTGEPCPGSGQSPMEAAS